MNMKLFYFLFLSISSCNLFDNMEKMNMELETAFNHNNIVTSLGLGTEDGDNHIQVTFYKYDLSVQTIPELEKLANKVIYKLLGNYPKFKQFEYIEIRFTEGENSEENDSYMNFRKTKDEF
ncbi:MAG: hypothetical protein L3J20_00630 [Flavobacteriaceae bacterium]|nr:hypothetical protein [Flavobacteriaceae bacterium]